LRDVRGEPTGSWADTAPNRQTAIKALAANFLAIVDEY